ncbi:hypothetical protein I4U23_030612 [Adineta vaga]|nr:hypothetical protein I4U23_030612 [Adineta vaga]
MNWIRKFIISRLLKYVLIISTILMLWKSLILITNCRKPINIVLSGGLGYSFLRYGDLLFLTNYQTDPIRAGDVVAFETEGRSIPIVHRVIRVHERSDGYVKFLTKGDDHEVDDRGLYSPGQLWIEREDIIGKVKGYFPYLGLLIILIYNLFSSIFSFVVA